MRVDLYLDKEAGRLEERTRPGQGEEGGWPDVFDPLAPPEHAWLSDEILSWQVLPVACLRYALTRSQC